MAPDRSTFPPMITASRWETAWQALVAAANRRNGSSSTAPRVTNGDAVALVKGWASASGTGAMPLWYHFAATAYGWEPDRADRLNTSAAQREKLYDARLTPDLWDAMRTTARGLDAESEPARIDIDNDTFDSPIFQAGVKRAIQADGGMRAAGKIPVGCRDPKSGKIVGPKMKCRPGFKLELVPGTPFFVCRNKQTGETEQPTYECEGETVFIDDPITAIGKALAGDLGRLALIVGLAYLVFADGKRSR